MYPLKSIPTELLGYRWDDGSPVAGTNPDNARWYPVVEDHLRAGSYPVERTAQKFCDQVKPVADSFLRIGRFVNHQIVFLVRDDWYIVSVGNRRLCVARAFRVPDMMCLVTVEWNDPHALGAVPYEDVKRHDPGYTHR